jgi:glycine oxidase
MPGSGSASDLIVVGGGVIGLSIAWQHVRTGGGVRLIEQGTCGCGASGVPWAALWPSAATKRGIGHQLHRESLWRFEAFVREIEQASGMPIEFARPGRLEIFTSEVRRRAAIRESEAAVEDWPAFSTLPVQQVVNQQEAASIEPNVQVDELGGMVCEATACVGTASLLSALRAATIRHGGMIEEESQVTDLWVDGGRVRGVVTDRPIAGQSVVIAAGAWSSEVADELRASTAVQPVKGEVIILRAERPLFSRVLKRGRTYMVPMPMGRVLVGSTSDPEAGFDATPTDAARESLWSSAIEMVPGLASATVERQWVGHRPQTASRAPYLGEVPGSAGLFVASGHFKIGVAMAPIVGELMHELLEGRVPSFDLSPFAPGR